MPVPLPAARGAKPPAGGPGPGVTGPGRMQLPEHLEAGFHAGAYQRADGAAVSVAQASGLA
jgi:hypothetical protein